MADATDNTNEHNDKAKRHSHQKVFFGVPAVGFFRQQQHTTKDRSSAASAATLTENMTSSKKGVTFQLDDGNNNDTNASGYLSSDDDVDESAQLLFRRGSYGSVGRTRSGKELWAILRRHVLRKEFHIRDTVRDASIFQSVNATSNVAAAVRFRDIDLPYDFSLLDCLMMLLAYLAISVIAYSFVFENWTMIDSMYFAVVTFTTIGYGDFSPSTTGGRLFCVLFALGGVAVLAIALGVVGHKIVEAQVSSITAAETQFVHDVGQAFRKKLTASQRRASYAKKSHNDSSGSSSFSYLNEYDQIGHSIRQRARDIKSPWHKSLEYFTQFGSLLAKYIPALAPLFLGAFLIGHYEGWEWSDVVYYCVVTTTTIGYGDLTPAREDMRGLAVIYIPLACGAMGHFLGTIATFIVDQRTKKMNEYLWKHELTIDDLRSISSSDGTVTELDFVVFMLKAMKKVDDDLIEAIRDHFSKLDLTKSGTLNRADLELRAEQQLRTVKTKLRLSTYKNELLQKSGLLMDSFEEEV